MIKDKVAVLGPNDGAVKLLAPDGFTQQSTIDEAGPASAGMFMSIAGVPIDEFVGSALEFKDGLEAGPLQGESIDPYAIYGGQAIQVMLDAIEASDGSREDVLAKLFETEVVDGLIGSFAFNENGDPRTRGCRCRLHDLQGDGQARNGDDDHSEAGYRRRRGAA